jgi:hypothetical protein
MNLFIERENMTKQDVQENLQGILELIDFLCDDINNLKIDGYDRIIIENQLSIALENLEDVKTRLNNAED